MEQSGTRAPREVRRWAQPRREGHFLREMTESATPLPTRAGPRPLRGDGYRRYHIGTETAAEAPYPAHFRVEVKRHRLAWLILREILHYRGKKSVILSRPCVYGVFSGPVGGFAPREHLCVGCLRCTTEHPDIVQIRRNPEHERLGDSYFTADRVDAVSYEARTGRIPVRGAGYRGRSGGAGWDGMWTDLSEIVRPTRDGIHGREFISTVVDIGEKPAFLEFDDGGLPVGPTPRTVTLPIPMLFDAPPASALSRSLACALAESARETETLAILPAAELSRVGLRGRQVAPLVTSSDRAALRDLPDEPALLELASWDPELFRAACGRFPESVVAVRVPAAPLLATRLLELYGSGVRAFHLVADYHGRGAGGRFLLEAIREAHRAFVEARCRDEATLLGSGGIIAAEHVPKAILCGLDAVALETPALVALGARMIGECRDREASRFALPPFDVPWGVQRLKNLLAAWRDQLLEVLGAMGMREVRRLRGEIGRAMFQQDLEREAFEGITGYVGD